MIKSISGYQDYIESALAAYTLPNEPEHLYAPIHYFLKLGGKRMRPILALMGASMFDADFSAAKHAALAVELFHNFTLIHDDIMDKAPLRRGQTTVHTKWNENIAILSGDTLLIEAYKQLCHYPPATLAKLLPLFNQTAIEVCEGQQLDMDFETMDTVEIDSYLKMIAYKTAVLLGCSLKMGAIIGGADETDADDLYRFGLNLGIAFQIQDDILDVYAEQDKFGKQVGGDILSNKKTFLLLKAMEDSNSDQRAEFEKLKNESDPKRKIEGTMALYQALAIREKATQKMNEFHTLAMQNLEHINRANEAKEPLRQLAAFLLGREH